jgi:hypothetical protein
LRNPPRRRTAGGLPCAARSKPARASRSPARLTARFAPDTPDRAYGPATGGRGDCHARAPRLSHARHACHTRVTRAAWPAFHVTFHLDSRGNVTLNARKRRARPGPARSRQFVQPSRAPHPSGARRGPPGGTGPSERAGGRRDVPSAASPLARTAPVALAGRGFGFRVPCALQPGGTDWFVKSGRGHAS